MTELNHLSYSSINTYLTCPRSWHFRYVDKIPVPKSVNLVFGSAFHATVEDYIASRALGAECSLVPLWHSHWSTQLETSGEVDFDGKKPESYANDGTRILSSEGVQETLDAIEPLIRNNQPVLEKKVTLTVPGVPIPVIGYIDIITADGVPGDIKTSSRAWSLGKAQDEMQPVFYLAALNQAGFEPDHELRFRHYVFTKTKNPRADVLETQREPKELFWLFDLVFEVWYAISVKAFPPRPGSWKCSMKYCEYWPLCRGKE